LSISWSATEVPLPWLSRDRDCCVGRNNMTDVVTELFDRPAFGHDPRRRNNCLTHSGNYMYLSFQPSTESVLLCSVWFPAINSNCFPERH
jgi:hypothetical protein